MSQAAKQQGHTFPQILKATLASATIMLCALAMVPQAIAQDRTTRASIEALADKYDLPNTPVIAGQSRIIFYRPLQTTLSGAASVYINGRYHASLVPGGYSPICIKTGPVELGVRHMDVKSRPNKDGFDSITELKTVSGQNQYVRVNNQGAKAIMLVPVPPEKAQQELPPTRLQVHTISRVAEATDCIEAPAAPASPARSTRQLQLAGDTLFEFNRSDRAGLTQQGLRAIDQLMAQIRSEFSRVDGILLIHQPN